METSIEIRKLSKRYRLGVDATGYDTLRDAITRKVLRRKREAREIWALRDIDLEIDPGQAVGIIGDNGAGKTTLLKILARITEPTRGEARVRGRVGALLDVGTGFHLELTGRENVYLSGALLGLRRAEVNALFDAIIEFSGLAEHIDTPVKRYSAGMRLRLAFSVAAYIQPAILVVDEILAVGDAAFREKCLARMGEAAEETRTVLFVSHDLDAINKLCTRAIWLEDGSVRGDGPPHEIVSGYLRERVGRALSADFEDPGHLASLAHVSVRSREGEPITRLPRDRPFSIHLDVRVLESLPGLDVAVLIGDKGGAGVIDATRSDHPGLGPLGPGTYHSSVDIPAILAPGQYSVTVWIGTAYEDFMFEEVLSLPVEALPDDPLNAAERPRVIMPELNWNESHEPAGD
jgi:ABC-type polysaccharide/polyol phosphate transport system ATPase subunit